MAKEPSGGSSGGFGKGVFWSFALQIGSQLLGGGSAFVLAWLVGPYDFGLVSMATVFLAFLFLFLEAGLVTAIIQRTELEALHLDSVFWLNLAVGLALTAFACGGASWWAALNGAPDLAPVLVVMSSTLLLNGGALVQQALAQRDKDFKVLAKRTNAATLVGALVGIGWALVDPSVAALVAQRVLTAALTTVLLWRVVSWRPSLRFSWRHARDIFSFSAGVLLSRLAMRVAKTSDALLLGLFFGPETVGVYRLAKKLVDMAYTITTRPLGMVAMPLFAERQDRPDLIRETLLAAVKYSTMAAVPVFAALAVVAAPLTGALGDDWLPAGVPLAVLSVVGAVRAVTAFTDPLLFAIGKPMVRAMMVGVLGVCNPLAFVVASLALGGLDLGTQLLGIAMSELAVYAVVYTPLNLWIAQREVGGVLSNVGAALRGPFLAGLLAACVAWPVRALGELVGLPSLVVAALGGGAGVVAGALALAVIEPEARRLARAVGRKLGRR